MSMSLRMICEDFIGTCQCCFGEYKVGSDKRMVIHGYKRPGVGYVHSECPGTDELAYEYSCEFTKQIRANTEANKKKYQNYLGELEKGVITTLTYYWREWDDKAGRNGYGDYVTKNKEIGPDSEHWAKTLAGAIHSVKSDIWDCVETIKYLDVKITEWKLSTIVGIDSPATGKMRYVRLPYDPATEEENKRKAEVKAARDAKPGKLKVVLFFVDPGRAAAFQISGKTDAEFNARMEAFRKNDEEFAALVRDKIKPWAKKTFPSTDKPVRVSEGSDFDLPRNLRRTLTDKEQYKYRVINLNVDWSYLDQMDKLVTVFDREDVAKKNIVFFVDCNNQTWA